MGEVEEVVKETPRRRPPTTISTTIPFRPRKLRKLTNTTTSSNKNDLALTPPPVLLLPRPLTSPGEIAAAIDHLRLSDPLLTPVIAAHEPPSFPVPLPPFHSLARSILYQQLSPKAASTIYTRFLSLCSSISVSPSSVLSLSPQALRAAGVSARKASYLHDLALKFHSDVLSEDKILASSDEGSLMSALTAVRGIGPWSVHMFMIFSLHRPDVLPVGDLGVRKGVRMLYGLDKVPMAAEMEALCESWRPYRSVGAWYMWRLAESTLSRPG
ncbi:uncharacterized protein M6B38_314030 [Iris pallida]|uniref:HhH-GPD domain-containing protein n=1 Tax=Iris pallida TaxID=29817 RepID=A0AAX6HFU8_IRIPA|nr:uncharacterized protein M6B38_314030 [Iris pallida]